MKFHFKEQEYQTRAVQSIVDIFNGQPPKQYGSQYKRDVGEQNIQITFDEVGEEIEYGYKNPSINLSQSELLKNIRAVQTANNIYNSTALVEGLGKVSLDIEMETGTGKTFVYIDTMFKLFETYGWNKFIIVVPSIAIREGIKKTFEMTQDYFMKKYGFKARYFIYNSSELKKIDDYSKNQGLNVMIINTQAFNATLNLERNTDSKKLTEAARIIYSNREEFGSRKPIDVIKANNPIIILDEPQKMGGEATQNALKENFNPLFSLNFSATHKASHNLIYALDALDAYKSKLVKKIEVKGFEFKYLTGSQQYLYLSEIVVDSNKPPRARLEIEVQRKNDIKRETKLFAEGSNLFKASNGLEQYNKLYIQNVDPINSIITLSNGETLIPGEAKGLLEEEDIKRIQIRETIISHLEKEEKLYEQGIKCLSLFFIDDVSKYRKYDGEGNELQSEYSEMFEEEYNKILNEKILDCPTEYKKYLQGIKTEETHKGYFSIDKKGKMVNSKVKRGNEFSDDISAYDLILKNKERLLSFKEQTRFIFSHSALREGWDNPNIFQICTLKNSHNKIAKRQEVGRGLRLCVNSNGERQDVDNCGEEAVHEINTLTIIASESYNDFVTGLQSELKEDIVDRPTTATIEFFKEKVILIGDETHKITEAEAISIYNYLVRNDYVDDDGIITRSYLDITNYDNYAPFRENMQSYGHQIHGLIQSIYNPILMNQITSNAHKSKVIKNPLNQNWDKFIGLWNQINKKYAYTVEFDSSELIGNSISVINKELKVNKLSYTITKGTQTDLIFNIESTNTKRVDSIKSGHFKYDLIGKIAENTTLTRKSVAKIISGLTQSKMSLFAENPEDFIVKVSKIINEQKASIIVEHIIYTPSAEEPYSKEIFNMSKTSIDYANAFQAKNSIQDYIITDGLTENSIERKFAEDLDVADEVIVYAKLPKGSGGFYIPTPVGKYTPDWAIVFKKESVKHIFFIAETKGSMDSMQLRPIEQAKINCAKKLFNELSDSKIKYHDVDNYQNMLNIIEGM